MLTPRTLRPYEDSIPMIVLTHSYRIEFPVFLFDSVFVAIWAKMSFISSEASGFFSPRNLSAYRILTCKNGSLIPAMSYSGAYPLRRRFLSVLIRQLKYFLKVTMYAGSILIISFIRVTPAMITL